jgi:IS1 family transposase
MQAHSMRRNLVVCVLKAEERPRRNEEPIGVGDVWTWTALCAGTKIVPCWQVGPCDLETAKQFMGNLAGRLSNRVQITTDGHRPYVEAVEDAFGSEVDFAQLIKLYGDAPSSEQKRYSPAQCTGTRTTRITEAPNQNQISTSFVERQNLTIRMSMRRFTRLTNAFSKKLENHMHAISLDYMYYNFGRIHQTLRVTPAMEAGVADHVWALEEIAALAPIKAPKKRGPYKKQVSD